jgi:hypothetical protein
VVLGFWAWALWAFVREPWAPHGRVGVAALGNSVFRVECICMGLGRVMRLCVRSTVFGLVGPPRSGRRSPGPVGSFSGLPGSLWSCCQVLYLVLRVRARALICLIRCTTHSQSDVPGVLVLERLRVVAGKKSA